jgi:hypothetical protein
MDHLPSFAFATSPAEIDRGAVYEFVLDQVDGGTGLTSGYLDTSPGGPLTSTTSIHLTERAVIGNGGRVAFLRYGEARGDSRNPQRD